MTLKPGISPGAAERFGGSGVELSAGEVGGKAQTEAVRSANRHPYAGSMNLQLTDEQAAALERELRNLVETDRYPFSPRIRTLREILRLIRPEPLTSGQRSGGAASTPVREPLPPLRHYDPPRGGRKVRFR